MHEPNELLALVFAVIACVATLVVRSHPDNTPRTRQWWGRFIVLVCLLAFAQVATNVEQLFPLDGLGDVLNALEHLSLITAGFWALAMCLRGLAESYAPRPDPVGRQEPGSDEGTER